MPISRTGRPADLARQAAQDAAVAALLDLDTRQRYVEDAVAALAGAPHADTVTHAWAAVAQQCFDASGAYLSVAEQFGLDGAGSHRPPEAGTAAFTQVTATLASAAGAVDQFYQANRAALESARALEAATPRIAAAARADAQHAQAAAAGAAAGLADYPSVVDGRQALSAAVAALERAEAEGTGPAVRSRAAAVTAAAHGLEARLAAAAGLADTVRHGLASVATRIAALRHRLDGVPAIQSALRREFSAACADGVDAAEKQAFAALGVAQREWDKATAAQRGGAVEEAAARLAAARAALAPGDAATELITDRLPLLRAVRENPGAAAATTRFRVRDAQNLVLNRNLVTEWGSALDAQSARVDRAVAAVAGPHPDYWAYLATLRDIEAFVSSMVMRVRGNPSPSAH